MRKGKGKGIVMRHRVVKTIDGIKFDSEKATCIASNEYWDGHNWERRGRNLHVYKTKNGRYFSVGRTQWQGEHDTLESLTKEQAKALYESLPEQHVSWEEAFDEQVQEA